MVRQYIPAILNDNPSLTTADPDYVHRLDALPEPYRTAYKTGDWDIFIGQIFAFTETNHVVRPMPVPESAPILMTFDWGFGKPYSVGWWWEDADGRLYRCAELYGCAQGQVDVGLRQTDDEIAERIIAEERRLAMWTPDRHVTRLAGPDCFQKRPDYRGGGQGPSTAEVWQRHGLVIRPGDPARTQKIRAFHGRLNVRRNPDGEMIERPMLQVYDTCRDFIRTIPTLQADPHNPEDVDTRMEDHIFDEACHAVMSRISAPKMHLADSAAVW